MKFIAYRFDCWPLQLATTRDSELDEEENEIAQESFEKRLEILSKLFGAHEDVEYSLGDGTHPPFKINNDLILRTYKTKKMKMDEAIEEEYSMLMADGKLNEAEELISTSEPEDVTKIPKAIYDELIPARVIYNLGNAFVVRIQKKRPLEGEDKNYHSIIYKNNYVSSMVVLIFHHGMQYLLIENTRKTYSPATIARVFEHTFNRLLMAEYHIMVTVNPIRKLSDFWVQMENIINQGRRIKSIRFKFDYPNMPWPDDLLGGRFKRLGRNLNAEAEIKLKGQHGQMLDLKTKEGERDPDVNSMVRYSCDKGNKVYAELDNKSMMTLGNKQTGTVEVNLPDSIGDIQENKTPTLFPDNIGDRVLEEAQKLKVLNN